MVMRYSRSAAPIYVCYEELDRQLMQDYVDGLYRIDPVYRLCKVSAQPGVFTLDSLGTSERQNAQYSKQFLSQAGMVDDLIILFPAPGSCMIALIFERSTPFKAAEVDQLRQVFPLLAGMQKAHERIQMSLTISGYNDKSLAYRILDRDEKIVFDSEPWSEVFARQPVLRSHVDRLRPRAQQSLVLDPGFVVRAQPLLDEYAAAPGGMLLILEHGHPGMPPVNPIDAAELFTETVLTPRERDIVRLIFLGFPNAKIAEKLKLSVNTVKNHRKRLYHKLDITTERELLLRLISALFSEDAQPAS